MEYVTLPACSRLHDAKTQHQPPPPYAISDNSICSQQDLMRNSTVGDDQKQTLLSNGRMTVSSKYSKAGIFFECCRFAFQNMLAPSTLAELRAKQEAASLAFEKLEARRLKARKAFTNHINHLISWRAKRPDVADQCSTNAERTSQDIMTLVGLLCEVVQQHDDEIGERKTQRWEDLVKQVKILKQASQSIHEEITFHPTEQERRELNILIEKFNETVRYCNIGVDRLNEAARQCFKEHAPPTHKQRRYREFFEW